jgi:hypothetical protein
MTDEELQSIFQVLCANCNMIKEGDRRARKNSAQKDEGIPPST